jgi:hypothetical protein
MIEKFTFATSSNVDNKNVRDQKWNEPSRNIDATAHKHIRKQYQGCIIETTNY